MLLCYSDVGDTKRWWRGCWWQVWPFVATTLKRCHINSVANIQKLSLKPLEPQDFALSWLIKLDNQKITCGLLVIFHLRFFKCCWIAFWRSSSFKNGLSSLQYNRTRCPDFFDSRPESPDRKMHLIFTLEDRKRRQTRDKLFVPNLSIPSDQRSLELILMILRKPKNIETKMKSRRHTETTTRHKKK